jgi:hypothetical protein
MMRPEMNLLLAIIALVVTACAGPPKQYAIKSETYGLSNAGLVVGRIRDDSLFGKAIDFKNSTTGASFTYSGAAEFSMWLPEGDYEVSSIGSRGGSLGPFQKPLTFHVKKGVIAYVGTISYGCTQRSPAMKWYGLQNCGLLALGTCTVASAQVPMCVLDDNPQSIKSFLEQHAEFASVTVDSALMK